MLLNGADKIYIPERDKEKERMHKKNPQPQGITVNGWYFINKSNIKAWNQRLLSHFLHYAYILMGRL